MTDIVIPVLNEEKILREQRDYYTWLKTQARIIFVDGGSVDRTAAMAKDYGDVVMSPPGRALQMNTGAKLCRSSNILFLHVDTFLNEEALKEMNHVLSNGVFGGCFSMRIAERGLIFRIFEKIINFRSRYLKIIDGDLGLFVKREVFTQLNQFDAVDVMEDILFSRKMRKAGKVRVLSSKIFVSARRWREKGFLKTFSQYTLCYLQLLRRNFFFKKGKEVMSQ